MTGRSTFLILAMLALVLAVQAVAADPPLKPIQRPLYKELKKSLQEKRSAPVTPAGITETRQLVLDVPGSGRVEAVFPTGQLVLDPHGGRCVKLYCDWQPVRLERPCTTQSRIPLPYQKMCLVFFPDPQSDHLPMAYFFYPGANHVQVAPLP
jgi:hypothetical protein